MKRSSDFFRTHISIPMPPLVFFTSCSHPDLIEIRSKKRKEREEEKKKGSSYLHGDLVQIPSDLYKRVRAAIFFFKIWKKRSRSKDEERDLQDANTLMISML